MTVGWAAAESDLAIAMPDRPASRQTKAITDLNIGFGVCMNFPFYNHSVARECAVQAGPAPIQQNRATAINAIARNLGSLLKQSE